MPWAWPRIAWEMERKDKLRTFLRTVFHREVSCPVDLLQRYTPRGHNRKTLF
jgi:hypothetical protein